jgi:pimeloyl-ACP methyl ester carboxylesterase
MSMAIRAKLGTLGSVPEFLRNYTGVGGRLAPRRAAKEAGDDYGHTAEPSWRSIDWQAHLHQVELDGRRVNYVDIGEGEMPPAIFVHGLGGCWQNWLENIPRLAQERRCIALDLPGFSCSEMPKGKITIPGYAETVVELARAIGIDEPVDVIGNSMGGFIAAELGIEHADFVHRIVLCSAAGISITNLKRMPVLTSARMLAAVTNFTLARREAMVKRPGMRHSVLAYVVRHPTLIDSDLAYHLMSGSGSPGFLPALEALTDYDFRDRLGNVKVPVLLVWGREDNLVPVKDADEFERLIPNARKVIFEDTGHVPMLERPQTFDDLVVDFLAEPEGKVAEAEAPGEERRERFSDRQAPGEPELAPSEPA